MFEWRRGAAIISARTALVLGLLLAIAAGADDFPLECDYARSKRSAPEPHARCAAVVGNIVTISRQYLAKLAYTTRGLAALWIEGSWYYAKRNGDVLRVPTVDNDPDDFSEGLVRSVVDGKTAYFDDKFHEVIPPTYDHGFPFDAGRALVCTGCKAVNGGKGQIFFEGGQWGYIDKRGKEIVPVTFTREEAMAR